MTALPLSLRTPAACAFAQGRLTRVRRPASGMLRNVASGDHLWIREPFRLKRKFAHLSPTAAVKFGARPYFAADLNQRLIEIEELGEQYAARSLLKQWHRMHARVIGVDKVSLQGLTLADARAEGFGSIAAWARNWDETQKAFGSRALYWQANPVVLLLTLEHVATPLPQAQQEAA